MENAHNCLKNFFFFKLHLLQQSFQRPYPVFHEPPISPDSWRKVKWALPMCFWMCGWMNPLIWGWSVVLLCHVLPYPLSLLSMVSQWQLATLKLSATLPWAVGARPRSLWFLLLLTTLKSLLLPCLISLTQTSHLAKVKESLSLTASCVAVCYYFLFSWDSPQSW